MMGECDNFINNVIILYVLPYVYMYVRHKISQVRIYFARKGQ